MQSPLTLCDFLQWLETEQSKINGQIVLHEMQCKRNAFELRLHEQEEEEKQKHFREKLRKEKAEAKRHVKEKREAERKRKREIARRVKEDAEDGGRKGKYPRWTQ